MTNPPITPERGCGHRIRGGVYIETKVGGTNSIPFNSCIIDPPHPHEPTTKRGVEIILGSDGNHHILDYVGLEHYPYPSDVIEEGRRYGFSRRISPTSDFSKLTKDSKLLLIHPRAIIRNIEAIHKGLDDPGLQYRCVHFDLTGKTDHMSSPHQCSRTSYAFAPATVVDPDTRTYTREFTPGTAYTVHPVNPEAPVPDYAPGIIASLPITSIAVIKHADGEHEPTLAQIRKKTTIPVNAENT